MSYCTIEDLMKIPVCQRGLEEPKALEYIDRAERIVNGYLRGRVPGIPFTSPVPEEIRDLAVKFTVCEFVKEQKTLHGANPDNMYGIEMYCKDAMDTLKAFATGNAQLEEDPTDIHDYSFVFYTGNKDFETSEL